ncbi:MAG: prolipoprotein diacylglyceryl transferase [Bryobacteraceae bacterium]|nr:prolipoprotein diacylglyceryl transferase [Bryobacteraceae bacterium]
MFPKIISIGGFYIPTYGVLVATGFLLGLWVAGKLARRQGLDPEVVKDLGVWVALAGIVGAKLLMILYDIGHYIQNPGDLFSMATLQAGGVFYGGFVAALAAAVWYLRERKLPFLPVADVFAPGIALGHAIGRLGCFAAGCCWGTECHLPWAVTFRDLEAYKLVGVPLEVPLHPTQLYEAMAELAIFAVLYRAIGKPHVKGRIIGLYLVLYPAARFLVEFVRAHEQANPFGWVLTAAQWMALGLLVLGCRMLMRKGGTTVIG